MVGRESEEMRAHLGSEYQYICQEEQLGTGHAVLQLKPLLADFHGDLFINLWRYTALPARFHPWTAQPPPPAPGKADPPERRGGPALSLWAHHP